YDYAIIATGSHYSFFGHQEWADYVYLIKDIQDANNLRQHIVATLERAMLEANTITRRELLTFVIIGGGPTGVELAGALADLMHHIVKKEFRGINLEEVRIVLLEAGGRLLSFMPTSLAIYADRALKRRGVTICYGAKVEDIKDGIVRTHDMV